MAVWRLQMYAIRPILSSRTRAWVLARLSLQSSRRSFSGQLSTNISEVSCSDDVDLVGLQRRAYRYEDWAVPQPTNILEQSLAAYFASGKELHAVRGPKNSLQIGHQHAYFRPDLTRDMLCDDGTDIKFLPGPPVIWKYRLWAGGSVTLFSQCALDRTKRLPMTLSERALHVRAVTRNGTVNKVFVTIERNFAIDDEQVESKDAVPNYVSNTEINSAPFMTETENICFLRDQPSSLQDTRRIKPPSNPTFAHVITPTRDLLFQFSALTYNAHRIHLDPEFARDVYGATDMIVHGPLTLVLMSKFIRYILEQNPDTATIVPVKIDYTNMQPLYVNEPLRLCCKPTTEFMSRPVHEVGAWQVWIEKGGHVDNGSCAVKATVLVGKG